MNEYRITSGGGVLPTLSGGANDTANGLRNASGEVAELDIDVSDSCQWYGVGKDEPST